MKGIDTCVRKLSRQREESRNGVSPMKDIDLILDL